ncbi:HET-domain-containing protein, partial [Trematosphaeria pertusa]
NFQHNPLDHGKDSIRLIEILPDLSASGGIQCSLKHADVSSEYTCLSYVWGSSSQTRSITVNGRDFQVHLNLWDFLGVARTKYHSKPLWIDAISIDQSNTAERNHQVQLMGQIFGSAGEVIAWLGNEPDIAEFLAQVHENPSQVYDYFYEKFCNAQYWTRAWITQEVALARHVAFWSRQIELNIAQLSSYQVNRLNPASSGVPVSNTLQAQKLKGEDLVRLLDLFCDKECKIKRDRIFSLLALCGRGSELKVDYGAPDDQVLLQALR